MKRLKRIQGSITGNPSWQAGDRLYNQDLWHLFGGRFTYNPGGYASYSRSFDYFYSGNVYSIEVVLVGSVFQLGSFDIDGAIEAILQTQDMAQIYSGNGETGLIFDQLYLFLEPRATSGNAVGVNFDAANHQFTPSGTRVASAIALDVGKLGTPMAQDPNGNFYRQLTTSRDYAEFFGVLAHEMYHSYGPSTFHRQRDIWRNRHTFQTGQFAQYWAENFPTEFPGFIEAAEMAAVAARLAGYNDTQVSMILRSATDVLEQQNIMIWPMTAAFLQDQLQSGSFNQNDLQFLATLSEPGGPLHGFVHIEPDSDGLFHSSSVVVVDGQNLHAAVTVGEFDAPFSNSSQYSKVDSKVFDTEIEKILADTTLSAKERATLLNSVLRRAEVWAGLGNIIGSTLGAAIVGSGRAGEIVGSAFFGALGGNIAREVVYHGGLELGNIGKILGNALDTTLTPTGIANAFVGSGVGTVSSMLTLELADALGLEGDAAALFGAATGGVVNRVVSNVLTSGGNVSGAFSGLALDGFFDDVTIDSAGRVSGGAGSLAATAIASFIGAKLGSYVVSPETETGAVLSSMGSAIGSWALSPLGVASSNIFGGGWFAANMLAPGIGAFVGFVIGALVGNLFGKKRPKIPSADAETLLNFDSGYFALGSVNSQNGGNEDLVRDMATAARDSINNVLELVTRNSKISRVANFASPTQVYGHTADQIWVKLGSSSSPKNMFESADEAVDRGVTWALKQTKTVGGDVFAKRVIFNSESSSIVDLAGSLQIATDYGNYVRQRTTVNAAIAQPYQNLSEADRAFYDLHSARFDQAAIVGGIPATQLSAFDWYSDYQQWRNDATETDGEPQHTRIGRLIDALNPSQFAAGWIITLQRAAELGLNKTSVSDFYGGLGGFTDSLRILSGQDFDNEDVHFEFAGTTLNVDYGRWNGRPEDNLLRGGDLSLGTAVLQAKHDYTGSGASETIEQIDGVTAMRFQDNSTHQTSNGHRYGQRLEFRGGDLDNGRHFEVVGGEYVAIAFEAKQLGASQNRLSMRVDFFDASGTSLNRTWLHNGYSTDWERRSKTVQVAAGAAYARVYIHSFGGLGNEGTAATTVDIAGRNFQFNRSSEVFGGAPDYSAPVYERFALEDFLADGGFNEMTGTLGSQPSLEVSNELEARARTYHPTLLFSFVTLNSSTGQDNTSGNDIYLHTGSSGITIDDYHTETATIDYEYIVPGIGFETAGGWITDTFTITGGDDIFRGGSGNDTLRGRGGYDWLDGGDGNDVIYGGSEDDVILGGGGSDKLYGEDGDDYIAVGSGDNNSISGVSYGAWGGNGNDTLVASSDDRSAIRGENGDDLLIALDTGELTYFNGGSGTDTVTYERFARGVTISMNVATVNATSVWRQIFDAGRIYGVENLTGTNFDDDLTGDGVNNTLRGLGGDDILRGGGGVDTLEGGAGADTLRGDGNADYASYESSTSAVWIDFQNEEYFGGHAEGDTMVSVNRSIGSDYADTFFDRDGWNTQFVGGRGDDWFVANRGSHNTDHFYGDEDFDTVDYADVASAVTINMLTNSHGGAAAGNRLFDIEQVVGSDFNDHLTFDAKDNYIQGGKGNDILYGGAGLDTYIYNFGDGRDTVYETEDGGGYDTLVLLGMNWADIHIYSTDGGGGRQGAFNIDMADGGQVSLYRNQYHWEDVEAGVDALDVGGVGSVDIGRLMAGAVGGNGNDTVYGDNTRADFIRGYAGNDTLYAAGSSTATETDGNLIWGGRGNDTLWASVGDDEYIFDIGDGFDTIRDSGGDDRIQFGPDVMADDVIYEVIGNDLYIGLRDYNDPDKTASQVDDRIRVVDGGTTNTAKRIEYLTAGGVDIDLAKLDINWTDTGGSGGGGSGGGGSGGGGGGFPPPDGDPFPPGGQLPPVVFDLDGDGLELVGLDESRVVFQSDSGGPLWRLGWVGADDGMLALDRDGNGLIDRTDEISFKNDFEGATTDLEGLRGYDTNGDGLFSAEDEQWSEFRIWQDVNQNGIGTADELVSLEEAGVLAIDLTLTASGSDVENVADSVYTNTAEALMADGGVMTAYDVALRFGLARSVNAAAPDASVWAGFDPSAAGALGIAYEGAEFSEAAIAELVRSWDLMTAGPDGAEWIDLQLYQDVLDSLAAPEAPEADPNDPLTETFGVKPIVIDLAGDGLNLLNPAQSPIQMDADGDGALDRIGWVEHFDGMLALDRNGNGEIDGVAEISFVDDLAGANTDLEGLRAYDSDGDGWLSAGDARFHEFSIWQDLNYDGRGSAGELVSLEEAGLERLSLHHIEGTASAPGPLANQVFGEAEIVWSEGVSGGNAGDVELRAYRGFLDEQMIDEFQRLLAQERAVNGAFAFNADARRAAMDEHRNEMISEGMDDGSGLPRAMDLRGQAAGGNAADTGLKGYSDEGAHSATASQDRASLAPSLGRPTRTARGLEIAGLDSQGLSNAELGSRWWTRGADNRAGRGGANSLAARLAELDRDRSAIAADQTATSQPRSTEDLAEQQRLLQAIASFRGSSGVAAMRPGEAMTEGPNDLFASRRALSRTADDFKQALYG